MTAILIRRNGPPKNDKHLTALINLKAYPQFWGKPITRLALKNKEEARQLLSQLTRRDTSALKEMESAEKRDDGFLLKINGVRDAPKGICRPDTAADWVGGILSMPLKGKSASSRFDMSAGPVIERGAALYIWTHEGEEFGNGWGMTAKAVAGKVLVDGENL